MLSKLFRRLTPAPDAGGALFDALTSIARQPGWYVDGAVADSIDGRFAVLATVTALALNRADQLGLDGEAFSVALTERFVTVMESEHRELGLGDPSLGKVVRSLVGALGKRVGLWREAIAEPNRWPDAVSASLYPHGGTPDAIAWSQQRTRRLWQALASRDVEDLRRGMTE